MGYDGTMSTPTKAQTRPVVVKVSLSPEQYEKLKRLAEAGDRSMVATVRRLIDRAAP